MGGRLNLTTRLQEDEIEKFTREGYWINKTLADYLIEAAEKFPDKEAVVDRDRRVTYRQLFEMVNRMASGLLELGVNRGDVVSFQLPNWLETVIIHHAASRIGAITNPILPIYRSAEVRHILKHARSSILIIPQTFRKRNYVDMAVDFRNELPDLSHILVIGGDDLPEGITSFEAFMETKWEERRDPSSLEDIKPDPNDVTLIMFTSGTEAEPKGVLHIQNTLNRECRSVIDAWQLGEDDIFLMPGPVTHIGGLLYGLELPQMLKAKVVFMDIWHPDKAIEILAKERCTWTAGATPFLLGMLRSPALNEHDLSSLRVFGCGGAAVPPSLIREFVSRFPNCNVGRGYGSTEYPTISVNYVNSPLDKDSETDGLPAKGTEVRIVDEENREVPLGESGEIIVRGPECFVGYLNPELNRVYFDDDGWFHTGDLGRMDKEGYVEVTGRKKDIIIRGGENLSAKEIEDVLYTHPSVHQAAVVGMPDPIMQERLCAYLVLKPGQSIRLEELIVFLEEKDIARQKFPERLEIMDSMPMTASGKIQKYVLRMEIKNKLLSGK